MAIINFRQNNLDAAWDDFMDLLASGRFTMDALFYLAQNCGLSQRIRACNSIVCRRKKRAERGLCTAPSECACSISG